MAMAESAEARKDSLSHFRIRGMCRRVIKVPMPRNDDIHDFTRNHKSSCTLITNNQLYVRLASKSIKN
ncbi:hypothetical protein P5673_008709 [Acropora cervicornis]|uniref:Uncharacterized protein n=1 Tax=Acropora cervicornis TaxID=6130 RepID=A0AAD9QSW7_ACRCE|nr:hypothetical protein P5673_008709 [Acropora cervicornis]